MISTEYRQRHFQVYEIILPYCAVCTSNQDDGSLWYTPITCDESSDSEYSLFLTENGAPLIEQPTQAITGTSRLNSSIFQCVKSGSEVTPLLKAGKGLASRSTMNISCSDFAGDPGPINFSDEGTFFGKLLARNILDGKEIKTHYYTKDSTQSAAFITETHIHYIETASLSNGTFSLSAKDGLKFLEDDTIKFPAPSNMTLSADLNDSSTTVYYSGDYTAPEGGVPVIKIGSELMRQASYSTTTIGVFTRGDDITSGSTLISSTIVDSHSEGDSIQMCPAYDDGIVQVLSDIFTAAGIPQYIDLTQWNSEVDAWNLGAKIVGVFHEPDNISSILNKILSEYMIDMWLDQSTQKAVLSSVSTWQPTERVIIEGDDFAGHRVSIDNSDRYSRCFIKTNKPYQTDNDDLTSFRKLTIHADSETESNDFYGQVKTNEFDPSSTLATEDATILVKRFVERYSTPPKKIMINMEERKLAGTSLGDVVEIVSRGTQLPSGIASEASDRAQIIKIQPKLNGIGRSYDVTALSYVPYDPSPLLIFNSNRYTTIDIHASLGAPGIPLDAIVVLDGAEFGSDSVLSPTIRAGNMAAGSTIRVFCINGAKVAGKGGNGGASNMSSGRMATAVDGQDGGNTYESGGIETHFYINWSEVDGYTASSELYAAGAGGGGAAGTVRAYGTNTIAIISNGGGGGSGLPGGDAGIATQDYTSGTAFNETVTDGIAGTFDDGGAGHSHTYTQNYFSRASVLTVTSKSGKFSLDTDDAEATQEDTGISPGDPLSTEISLAYGVGASAGYSFTGGNITVYNLAADSAKFRDGSSAPVTDYTLVDA